MATESVSKPVMENGYEDDDDDKPIVFKRRSSTVDSSSNQSKSNPQRSKAAPLRSPVTSPNGTTPSNRTSTMKSSMPSCSSKASPLKSPLRKDTPSTVKDRNQSLKDQTESKRELEDSKDNTPLSFILSGNSSRSSKGPTSLHQVSSPQSDKKNSSHPPLDRAKKIIKDESDDEAPISSIFQKKIGSGTSGSKQVSIDEKKPLVKKLHRNGSAVKNEVPNCKVSGKRPLEKNSSADESSSKKLKVSASPTLVKMKQDSVLTERSDDKGRVLVSPKPMQARQLSSREDDPDDDDDDDVPISKRLKSDSSNSKISSAKPKAVKLNSGSSAAKPKAVKLNSSSSAAKPKVTRVVSPPSRTMTKNSKTVKKHSKYPTSSKSLPSSGDGQKKWTTMVHNGVIFPPSYKPHGIKIVQGEAR